MVDKGKFIVDEVEHEGAPDVLVLRARSAQLGKPICTKKTCNFHKKAIGDILATIAGNNSLAVRISPSFKSKVIDHIDQSNESDIHFLNRIGKLYDAVATVKKDALVFLPIGESMNSKGEIMPTVTISRKNEDRHRYNTAERDAYSGVRARWHDKSDAKEYSELVGSDDNPKRLRHVYASAKAEWNRIQRGEATLQFSLALGRPDITPMTAVRIPTLKAPIGSMIWRVCAVH